MNLWRIKFVLELLNTKYETTVFFIVVQFCPVFNNVKPKDWYFVLVKVRIRTELGFVRLTNQNFGLDGSRA